MEREKEREREREREREKMLRTCIVINAAHVRESGLEMQIEIGIYYVSTQIQDCRPYEILLIEKDRRLFPVECHHIFRQHSKAGV